MILWKELSAWGSLAHQAHNVTANYFYVIL